MDITAVGDSKEAMFADIMSTQLQAPSANIEMRDWKKRRDGSKPRPVSMTIPPSSTYSSPIKSGLHASLVYPSANLGGLVSGLRFAESFPFMKKPRAFFSSEQHLPARVEGYNQSREDLYQLKVHSSVSQNYPFSMHNLQINLGD